MSRNSILLWLTIFIVGVGVGWLVSNKETGAPQSVREGSAEYEFINPLLFVEGPEAPSFPRFTPMKNRIEAYVNKAEQENQATEISAYYRDLNTSRWFAVNPEATFSPASMLKVVTLIATLRVAESDPAFLRSRVTITDSQESAPTSMQKAYPPADPILLGHTYTVDELLQHLIIDSDNSANRALSQILGTEKIQKVYEDLQLPDPTTTGSGGEYRTQDYSHLFRAIYNGSYLSRDLSEQVLKLLSRTYFDKGIVAGVPSQTTVSHKFGVHYILEEDDPSSEPKYRELHDCGIVYYPERPYFLCVMTRGTDFEMLEQSLQEISHIAWEETEKLK